MIFTFPHKHIDDEWVSIINSVTVKFKKKKKKNLAWSSKDFVVEVSGRMLMIRQ